MYAKQSKTAAPDGIVVDNSCRSASTELPLLPDRLLALALAYGLSAYDAAYLELVLRHKLPIAARDGKLKNAAEKSGVGLVKP